MFLYFQDIDFPMSHKQIQVFLLNNKWLNISIRILCLSNGHIYTVGIYGNQNSDTIIPLLVVPCENSKYERKKTYYGVGHFVRITSVSFTLK